MAVVAAMLAAPLSPAGAEGAGVIAGVSFQDLDRDAVVDQGEASYAGQEIHLINGTGTYLRTAVTDAGGRYAFSGLEAGDYDVEVSASSWSPLRRNWTPTTTGSPHPRRHVTLGGAATADFGWRPVRWSSDLQAPISVHTGASGLRSESFNDAVPASALHDLVMQGDMVGPEAAATVIRLGYSETTAASIGIQSSNGVYTSVSSAINIGWNAWLDEAAAATFHEWGHAWSLHHAYLVQQDGTLSSYRTARGLDNDERVGTSYQWALGEMIAEDYRQLFGTPAAQGRAQANPDIPPAAAVPGLAAFLADTFTVAPAAPPPPPPPPAPVLSGLAMSPRDVTKSGSVSYRLSAPATVSVAILDASGARVRTLLGGTAQAAGPASVAWNRTDDAGRRVRAGTYQVRVDASGPGGSTSATASFNVR